MRSLVICCVLAACGGNDVDPRIIPGGGVGSGEIDGEINVHVIDSDTRAPIANATVAVGSKEDTTDETGLVVVSDIDGRQTVSVKASGYTSVVWADVNGANVTIPLSKLDSTAPDQATLSGTIAGWEAISVPANHIKAAVVLYSQTDDLGDAANSIETPNGTNICGIVGNACNWTVASRTGAVTLIAAIVDRDTKSTPSPDDDTQTIIGWAVKQGITVDKGVDQSGLVLDIVEGGNLEMVSVDYGAPPPGLTERGAVLGIELADDEVIQIPLFLVDEAATSALVPKRSVFGADATYRFTGIAQTAQMDMGAQSFVIVRGETGTTIAADRWLVPPTGVTATRTGATWERVADAKAHQITWEEADGDAVLQVTMFDASKVSFDVPAVVQLPTSGALTATVAGFGADFDVNDFSLDDDDDAIWGFAAQPAAPIQ